MNSLLNCAASSPRKGLDASSGRDDVAGTFLGSTSGTDSAGAAGPEAQEAEATFPQQLMDVIEQETDGGSVVDGERVLEWIPSGNAFVIRDKAKLEKEVLPKYFSVRCKFTSFVRKLYRWGFRQVEKELHGIMIFMHPNFVRGDKQRCLKMRSIVKKAQAQRAFNPGFLSAGAIQGFGTNNVFNSVDPNLSGNGMAPHSAYPPSISLNQGCAAGQYGSPSTFSPNQFAQDATGMSSTGMSSAEMFETALRLQRMEERQRQQMRMMDMLNTSKAAPPPPPSFVPAAWNGNNENSNNLGYGQMSKVKVASEIMLRDPNMEPSQALELARHFNN